MKNKQLEYFGAGSIKRIRTIIDGPRFSRIFLVTGRRSYSESGAQGFLESALSEKQADRFFDFDPNPDIEDLKLGIKKFKKFRPDAIIAVGGGSVIDMAKAIGILAIQKGAIEDYILGKKKLVGRGRPLIAIPTTSGAGSEATRYSVISVKKIKYSLESEEMIPEIAIIDPALTLNLPQKVKAESGADVLAQGIESYWSVLSTKESKAYARRAIRFSFNNLKASVLRSDKRALTAMSKAAHYSGKAINISKTTACHALSYPLTARFGLSHGHAVALTLGKMLLYNSQAEEKDITDKRGKAYVVKTIAEIVKMLKARGPKDAMDKLDNLFRSIGLDMKIPSLNIKTVSLVANDASLERMRNNPRNVANNDAKDILANLM